MNFETPQDLAEELADVFSIYGAKRSEWVSEFTNRIRTSVQNEKIINKALQQEQEDV